MLLEENNTRYGKLDENQGRKAMGLKKFYFYDCQVANLYVCE